MVVRGVGAIARIKSIRSIQPLYESTTGYAAAKASLRTYSKSTLLLRAGGIRKPLVIAE